MGVGRQWDPQRTSASVPDDSFPLGLLSSAQAWISSLLPVPISEGGASRCGWEFLRLRLLQSFCPLGWEDSSFLSPVYVFCLPAVTLGLAGA